MKLLIALYLICGIAVTVITMRRLYKKEYPSLCDGCEYLIEKNKPCASQFRYECRKRGRFDQAPDYCARYKPREDHNE